MKKDVEKLLEQYKPLILSTFKKFNTLLPNLDSKKELFQEIHSIFITLVWEYDDRRKVDFPYYIKKMLELRTYHYISKQIKVQKNEFPYEMNSKPDKANTLYETILSDKSTRDNEEKINNILNILSWDDNFKMGKKQKRLFIGLMSGKNIHQLAKEEGVKVSTLHTRLHFLIEKLKSERKKQQQREKEGTNNER